MEAACRRTIMAKEEATIGKINLEISPLGKKSFQVDFLWSSLAEIVVR